MGFGHSSRLHTAKILAAFEDLPVVIEIVDTEEKIKAFLPILDRSSPSGLVAWKKCRCCNTGSTSTRAGLRPRRLPRIDPNHAGFRRAR